MWTRAREVVGLTALLGLSLAVRWPFRGAVLIRDEAEYLLAGQRILRGDVPYRDLYLQKTPFTFYLSAGVQHFVGDDLGALRVAAFAVVLATIAAVYLAARRIAGPGAALFAAAACSAMAFDQSGRVYQTSIEAFLMLWIALAVAIWGDGAGRRWQAALLAGVVAGAAYQTKQSGLVVLVYLLCERAWHWLTDERVLGASPRAAARDAGLALLGFAAVFAGVAAAFAAAGALGDYLACTLQNNVAYVGNRWSQGQQVGAFVGVVVERIALVDLGFWVFGAGALAWRAVARRPARGSGLWILLVGLLAVAFAAGFPRRHYFEPAIVPLALGSGLACAWLARTAAGDPRFAVRLLAAAALGTVWLAPLSQHQQDLANVEARTTLPWFAASESIAAYVAERTEPDECFLIVGSEPQVYFLARRPPCSRLVISYPLTGAYPYAAALRQELRVDLASRRPRYVLLFADEQSLGRPDHRQLLDAVLGDLARDYVVEATLPGGRLARRAGAASVWVYRRR